MSNENRNDNDVEILMKKKMENPTKPKHWFKRILAWMKERCVICECIYYIYIKCYQNLEKSQKPEKKGTVI